MVWIILLIILGVVLVAGLIVLFVVAEKKRRAALAAWALETGMEAFDPKPLLMFLKEYEAWGPGYGHRNFDGYQGDYQGQQFQAFQHQSRTKSKDSENIHNFTVCIMDLSPAPNLRIKREHFGHKLVDAFGGEDIDFESDEFSRKFWVKCDDRKFAYDVLHPRMMEYFLEAPKAAWQWKEKLVLVRAGSFKPDRVQPMMDAAVGFAERLPKHL